MIYLSYKLLLNIAIVTNVHSSSNLKGEIMVRGVGGGSPANVAKYLKGIDFPANKHDLINRAKKNHAEEPVLQELKKMPEQEYGTMADVMKGYGKEH